MKTRLLVITNFITLALLGWVLLRNKIRDTPAAISVDFRTTAYKEQTEFHRLYAKLPATLVMFGTSFTARVLWPDLLGQTDVTSRGINGDLTSGMLARTAEIIRIGPAVCCIEGGLNDLESEIPLDSISANIQRIGEQLQNNHITPVLTAVFPLGKAYPEYQKRNEAVVLLNKKLQALAVREKWRIININSSIAPHGYLLPEFSQPDGCHLRAPAYDLWRKAVKALAVPPAVQ